MDACSYSRYVIPTPEVVMHAPKDIEASLTKAFDNGATMAKSVCV